MATTLSELAEMVQLHWECGNLIGSRYEVASTRLDELEKKTGLDMPIRVDDVGDWLVSFLADVYREEHPDYEPPVFIVGREAV
jgi:hypothetical protein